MVCAAGEGYDSSNATAIMSTRFRHNGETIVKNADVRCKLPELKRPKRLCVSLEVKLFYHIPVVLTTPTISSLRILISQGCFSSDVLLRSILLHRSDGNNEWNAIIFD